MNTLNDFLNQATASGGLAVTHVRSVGATPAVEPFVHKLLRVVRDVAPATVVSLDVVNRTADPAMGRERGVHAKLAAQAMWRPWPTGQTNLDIFAALHDVGRHAYQQWLQRTPGEGIAVAGAVLALAKGSPAPVQRAVDAVFLNSYADAYALFVRAQFDGNEAAISMGQEALDMRAASGDFTHFSTARFSTDTQAALAHSIARLRNGAELETPEIEAMKAAHAGTGAWMAKHGVGLSRAKALTEFIRGVTEAFAVPPEPAPEHRARLQ